MSTERPVPFLDNARSDRVKHVAGLGGRSAVRRRQGLFLAEGPQTVREALKAETGQLQAKTPSASQRRASWRPGCVIDQLYWTSELESSDPALFGLVQDVVRRRNVYAAEISQDVLEAMSDTQSPQSILAVCAIPEQPEQLDLAGLHLVAVLCRVQDPGNVGTIIRVADAVGADGVFLTSGSVDPFSPKVVRSTAGSLFHLPVLSRLDIGELAPELSATGMKLLAADGYGQTTLDMLSEAQLADPTAWMFGNEAQGLSDDERHLAVQSIAVPMYGQAESLNVATAATVCMYASAMQYHSAS
ncbi:MULTISPECIES: TrmH family RNA methyltransferase [Auritidibacter]|uniref:RNA methyltransferase n=1 Tax=Auritidibacter ignavus TaxID=678932 RepID=A0AAJ6AIH9_9MICC|nr:MULTISPECIES: RNA methyltransferase [Auritidibacter]PXA76446.1 RNA methyltransferase [Auritidibacter sp. NML120779]AXR73185.1 RNA methyltransferase [Auritidibacter sp. NML130574]PXA77463.1 RNA methyltransferase [Auritidibacter sp. NML100628]WGH83999.1 RNA methyltransferase [Auritidibacter ignavus]WGH93322.1 RNA methyltransferase [Auritidibacter ignavus]